MADFGVDGNRQFAQYKDVMTTGVRNGTRRLNDQTEEKPKFWIEVTKGGAGYFAVMVWNGSGFTEPWDTGLGRYGEIEPAISEARAWAEEEGLAFVEPKDD